MTCEKEEKLCKIPYVFQKVTPPGYFFSFTVKFSHFTVNHRKIIIVFGHHLLWFSKLISLIIIPLLVEVSFLTSNWAT